MRKRSGADEGLRDRIGRCCVKGKPCRTEVFAVYVVGLLHGSVRDARRSSAIDNWRNGCASRAGNAGTVAHRCAARSAEVDARTAQRSGGALHSAVERLRRFVSVRSHSRVSDLEAPRCHRRANFRERAAASRPPARPRRGVASDRKAKCAVPGDVQRVRRRPRMFSASRGDLRSRFRRSIPRGSRFSARSHRGGPCVVADPLRVRG